MTPMTPMPRSTIAITDPQWEADKTPPISALTEKAVAAALKEAGAPADAQVSVLLTNDAEMAALNKRFLGKNAATNVLAWPALNITATLDAEAWSAWSATSINDRLLGDIALSYEALRRESEAVAIRFEAHFAHLIVHGVLHLCGFDHIFDEDAVIMESTEARALALIGVANPYEN